MPGFSMTKKGVPIIDGQIQEWLCELVNEETDVSVQSTNTGLPSVYPVP
ncbi:hypothetical protein [Paenibacillus piri]|nr:hypothetical protein [Paenibacillus piri]